MLLEKLFLNVLIVLSPVLVKTAFADRWPHAQSPYAIGLLQGAASSLCLIFSFYALDLYWDLRYIPLIISTIYGGIIAGVINFVMILATRTYLGGNALLFGYVSISLAFLGPLLLAKKIRALTGGSRIRSTVLVSLLPSVVMLTILVSYTFLNQVQEADERFQVIPAVLMFAVVQVLAVWLSSMLEELNYERSKMKADILRAEKMKTLGELAASIAHEIRNPLTVVRGFLQLMRPNEVGKNQQYLDLAMGELTRAESIITDYLNFSKPNLTRVESFALSDVLHHIVTLLTPMAGNNNVKLEGNFEEGLYLYTDRGQLQQALVNVIKNAIEATESRGEVKVNSTCAGGKVKITISDNGKGMTAEQLSRIGTLFFSTKEVGTGLGTAVATRIIETMNGKIVYESKAGTGTTVTITLPLQAKTHDG
ncbi:ATP-binding protein [Paenibacillus alkalitolerans]|uniref:ATP-binding protein n=1 Tax=Paenibacillus alkalitolerans TaxID=2799335 RepID=UPI0018F6DA6E|nr:ATP-binding protein [Paenibacillus alkalitolerans]